MFLETLKYCMHHHSFMKLFIWLLMAAIILLPVTATEYTSYEDVTMYITLASTFNLVPTSSDATVDYVKVKQSFYPRDTEHQSIENFITDPQAIIGQGLLTYTLNYPKKQTLNFSVSSDVTVSNDY